MAFRGIGFKGVQDHERREVLLPLARCAYKVHASVSTSETLLFRPSCWQIIYAPKTLHRPEENWGALLRLSGHLLWIRPNSRRLSSLFHEARNWLQSIRPFLTLNGEYEKSTLKNNSLLAWTWPQSTRRRWRVSVKKMTMTTKQRLTR